MDGKITDDAPKDQGLWRCVCAGEPVLLAMTELIVIALFAAILGVQLYGLVKMRRTMGQVSLFLRALHRVFQEFSKANEEAVQSLRESQELLQKVPHMNVRSSKSKICKNCSHRLSFVRVGDKSLAFEYHCRVSKQPIRLTDACGEFAWEEDLPQS